ncbi:helix-turn-helix transcriptional regulator [Microbispora rosea]|uniref:helix-turn-helix transcriptional regulator n=1 Tax=Microbispora rosea TaxID=58117 RepID=UPI0004C4139E|nr:LuxR family transcriptional regulator [Microbispora rosea]
MAEGPGSRETSWPGWRGRSREWALVADLLRAARVGRGGVLLVEGRPGVGKSRMLDVAAATATRWGYRVVRGVADELTQLMPLAPLLSALGEPGCTLSTGDSDGVPGPADQRLQLLDQLQGPLETLVAHGPALLTLDDLQWTDHMTLLALRSLTGDFASSPLIWMLARTTGGGHTPCLDRVFTTLEREGATRIRLEALDDAAVTEVVADVLGAAPEPDVLALAGIADANPFLLVHLIEKLKREGGFRIADGRATLVSTRLPSARAVTRERLEELSGPTRHMLQVAGVLGRSFPVKDLAEMLGESTGDLLPMLEEATSAGIVVSAGHELAFRHDLLWEAVTENLSSAVRRALHREAGEILLKRGGSAVPAAAHLIHSAGHGDVCALRALDLAAREVLRSSPQTAADLATRALELTDATDPDWVGRAAIAVDALTAVGRLCEAADLARPALSRAPSALAHRLRCALAYILLLSGRPADAVSQADSLLSREDISRDLRGVAEWTVFWGLISLNDLREGQRRAEAVLADRDRHSDAAVVGALLMLSRCAMTDGRVDESFTHLDEALQIGNSGAVEAVQRPYARLLLGHLHRCLCQFDAADLAIRSAEEEIEALGVTVLAAQPALFRARVKLAAARLDDAAAEAEAGMMIADDMGTHGFIRVGLSILAYIAVRRGDMDGAARNMKRYACEPGAPGMLFGSAWERWVEAVVAEAQGDRERAMDILRPTYTDVDRQRRTLITAPLAAAFMTRLALASGNRAYAQTIVDTADQLARRNPGYPIFAAAAAHARGLLHADPADLAFAAANHPQLWERASAAEDLGVLLTMSGASADRERAIGSLDQAHDGYQQIGALRDAARARARLRALGVRRRHWAQSHQRESGWDSLTDTERAVAKLIAQGLTNRQAAARMFLSPHTISAHLRRIFTKLDIASRAELARIFAEERPDRDG